MLGSKNVKGESPRGIGGVGYSYAPDIAKQVQALLTLLARAVKPVPGETREGAEDAEGTADD